MFTCSMRLGVTALGGLSALALAVAVADAQEVIRPAPGTGANPASAIRPAGVGAFGVGAGGFSVGNPYQGLVVNPATGFNNPYGGTGAITSRIVGGANNTDPYYPGYAYSYPDPYGGFLRGAADVINAQGKFMVSNQEARLLKESVRQAKVETRRRIFDEWLYERANTPTLQDELERRKREEIRRSVFDPPVTEIYSAKAMNDLLWSFKDYKTEGPQIPVDGDALKRINVTLDGKTGNFGLLKNEGRLSWPGALLTPQTNDLRSKIDSWVLEAKQQAVTGKVDTQLIKELTAAVNQVGSQLLGSVNDLPFGQYTEAKRFLYNLEDSVAVLGRGDAGKYISGHYDVKGKTVHDVIIFMNNNGLVFAPAVSGDEGAYNALYCAMVSYYNASKALVAER